MKPHPRIRKTIKWGGAVVTVLLVVAGAWSFWYMADLTVCRRTVRLKHGSVLVGEIPAETLASYHIPETRFYWRSAGDPDSRFNPFVPVWLSTGHLPRASFPVWMCVALTALPTCIAWRLDTLARRRTLVGLCPKCNYDRAGIAGDAKCPECGAIPRGA